MHINRKSWTLQSFTAPSCVKCATIGQKSGRLLATGGIDNKVNLWAVGKDGCIMTLSNHTSPIQALTFDKDEIKLAAASVSGSIKIWDLEESKEVRVFRGHKSAVTKLEFHNHGKFIATGSLDSNIKIWDLTSKVCILTFKGHTDSINCLRFSPDGRWLVSGSIDNTVKLWDVTTGKLLREFQDHRASITSVEFHPQDLFLATSSKDHIIKLYNLKDFKLIDSSDCTDPIQHMCIHPENNAIYAATNDFLKIYESEPLSCMETVTVGWHTGFSDMAFTSNYNQLIGVSVVNATVTTHAVDIQLCPPFIKQIRAHTRCEITNCRQIFCQNSIFYNQRQQKELDKHQPVMESNQEAPLIEIQDHEEYERIFKKPNKLNQHMELRNPILDKNQRSPRESDNKSRSNSPNTEKYNDQKRKQDLHVPKVDRMVSETVVLSYGDNKTDEVYIDKLQKMHPTVFNALGIRHSHLSQLRPLWNPNNPSIVITEAAKFEDLAVLVDLLSILYQNSTLITINVASIIMVHLLKLVKSKHLRYVEVACQILKIILKNYSDLIKQNLANPSTKVDINREERYQKCVSMYDNLNLIRKVLCDRSKETITSPIFNEVILLLNLI